ncbi:YciI family protein [Pendulispora albinea]|uniref:YciI family protein n=1 Tax=Pendulispora albinea TaxID=2741071 RepID=A0ABZ2LSN2_9BACT
MFVIELVYKVPLEEIDARMKDHMVFLRKYYASGHFLVSGRKVPRDGGIIVAAGDGKDEIETIMREDPFIAHGLADFRVTEFLPSQRAKNLDALIR